MFTEIYQGACVVAGLIAAALCFTMAWIDFDSTPMVAADGYQEKRSWITSVVCIGLGVAALASIPLSLWAIFPRCEPPRCF